MKSKTGTGRDVPRNLALPRHRLGRFDCGFYGELMVKKDCSFFFSCLWFLSGCLKKSGIWLVGERGKFRATGTWRLMCQCAIRFCHMLTESCDSHVMVQENRDSGRSARLYCYFLLGQNFFKLNGQLNPDNFYVFLEWDLKIIKNKNLQTLKIKKKQTLN